MDKKLMRSLSEPWERDEPVFVVYGDRTGHLWIKTKFPKGKARNVSGIDAIGWFYHADLTKAVVPQAESEGGE